LDSASTVPVAWRPLTSSALKAKVLMPPSARRW
jgi:hypothetical protein